MEGFSKTQTTAMATQAGWIASGTLSGSLTPDLRDYFLNNLKTLAQNFANTLVGLLVITVEKIWNAVVGVLVEGDQRRHRHRVCRPLMRFGRFSVGDCAVS